MSDDVVDYDLSSDDDYDGGGGGGGGGGGVVGEREDQGHAALPSSSSSSSAAAAPARGGNAAAAAFVGGGIIGNGNGGGRGGAPRTQAYVSAAQQQQQQQQQRWGGSGAATAAAAATATTKPGAASWRAAAGVAAAPNPKQYERMEELFAEDKDVVQLPQARAVVGEPRALAALAASVPAPKRARQTQTGGTSSFYDDAVDAGDVASTAAAAATTTTQLRLPRGVSLEVRLIPASQNRVSLLAQHFEAFGRLLAVTIAPEDERAFVTFASMAEADAARRATHPVYLSLIHI